jgi:hypothetical protein
MECNIREVNGQMVFENLDVNNKVAETQSNWERGFWDGQEALAKPLPSFIHNKKALMWNPYERGYWFGREMALIERNIKRESI